MPEPADAGGGRAGRRLTGMGTIRLMRRADGYTLMRGRLKHGGRTYHTRAIGLGRNPTEVALAEAADLIERGLERLREAVGSRPPLAAARGGRTEPAPVPLRPNLSLARRFGVLERCGFACAYCGRRPPEVILQVDHVVPRAAGGADDDDNLVAACRDCNQGKKARQLGRVP